MGHEIIYQEFSKKATKEQISAERGSRDVQGFTLHNIVCDNYEEAVNKINEYDRGFYDDHGVMYYDYTNVKPTKAMENLMQRKRVLLGKKKEYIDAHRIHSRKSKTMTCPKCGSKLTLESFMGDYCPVCRRDLRSETVRERIAQFNKKIEECDMKYVELEKKQKSKAEIKWLVKLEWHV